jgi:hypothetical protein
MTPFSSSPSHGWRAQGREQFLEAALTADDEVDVHSFTNIAQIMRGYHETVAPLTDLQMVGRLVVAQAREWHALVALPLDHPGVDPGGGPQEPRAEGCHKTAGFTGQFDLWLTGTISALARQQLTERGMIVTEEVYKRVEIID